MIKKIDILSKLRHFFCETLAQPANSVVNVIHKYLDISRTPDIIHPQLRVAQESHFISEKSLYVFEDAICTINVCLLLCFVTIQAETQRSSNRKKNNLIKQGSQPDGGQMNCNIERRSLPGHPDCDTIQITFHFDDGIQSVSL